MDIDNLEKIVISKANDGAEIFLADIALIRWESIEKSQGEIKGTPYLIRLDID